MNETTLYEPAGGVPFLDRIKSFQVGFADSTKCEVALQYGLFFDGTDNNQARDKGKFADTNIARLWRSYPVKASQGMSSLYVPGVGTRFEEIDAEAEGWRGTAFGIGCESRVLYGLLRTLEFVRQYLEPGRAPLTCFENL